MQFNSIQVTAFFGLLILAVFSARWWYESRLSERTESYKADLVGWLFVGSMMLSLGVLAARGIDKYSFLLLGIVAALGLVRMVPIVWSVCTSLLHGNRTMWTVSNSSGSGTGKCAACGAPVVVVWGEPGTTAYTCEQCGETMIWQ